MLQGLRPCLLRPGPLPLAGSCLGRGGEEPGGPGLGGWDALAGHGGPHFMRVPHQGAVCSRRPHVPAGPARPRRAVGGEAAGCAAARGPRALPVAGGGAARRPVGRRGRGGGGRGLGFGRRSHSLQGDGGILRAPLRPLPARGVPGLRPAALVSTPHAGQVPPPRLLVRGGVLSVQRGSGCGRDAPSGCSGRAWVGWDKGLRAGRLCAPSRREK